VKWITGAKIKSLIVTGDHKAVMLCCLYLVIIFVHILSCTVDLFVERIDMAVFKFIIASILAALFFLYLRRMDTRLFALLLVGVVEIGITAIIAVNQFGHFSTTYPFLILFGFFFFFNIREALLLSLLHLLYWGIFFGYGAYLYPEHPILHSGTAIVGMVSTAIFFILFGIFYHYTTESYLRQLEHTNSQNELLLKEIHHRVKNNLNTIASIIGLQIFDLDGKKETHPREVLQNTQLRIESIAMIHESLYHHVETEMIEFGEYIRNLASLINRTLGRNIGVYVMSDHLSFPFEQMFRLGIIFNELFTNSIKYAFVPPHIDDRIDISLIKKQNSYLFVYKENRNGALDLKKIRKSRSLGMKMIQLTVAEMGGTLKIEKDGGVKFTISFSR